MTGEEPLIGSAEAAKILCVDRKTVLRWAKAGHVPVASVTFGGHRRYRRSALLATLESWTTRPAGADTERAGAT